MAEFNINAHIAARTADILAEAQRSVERMSKQVERTILARLLLGDTGVTLPTPRHYWDYETLDIEVAKEQLPLIRQALGCPLKMTGKYLADDKERLVRVSLEPTDFPTVTISYMTQLPKSRRGKNAPKCKIVKVRHKAYTTTALVCEAK